MFGIQIALAWGIKRNTPVLPKAVSENHIKENLEALHVNLDEDDMKAIENIGIRHRYLMQAWMFKPEEVPENYWDGEEWLATEQQLTDSFMSEIYRTACNYCESFSILEQRLIFVFFFSHLLEGKSSFLSIDFSRLKKIYLVLQPFIVDIG